MEFCREKVEPKGNQTTEHLLKDLCSIERAPTMTYSEALSQPSESAATEFGRAFLHGAVQSPLTGLAQLVDNCCGTEWAGSIDVIKAPAPAEVFSKRWHVQQLGGLAGMTLPFSVVHRGVSYTSNALLWGSTSACSKLRVISESMITGGAFEGILRPVEINQQESLFSARMKNAITGATTFGTLCASSLAITGLTKGRPGALHSALRSEFASGILAGLPAGFVNAELSSVLHSGSLASGAGIKESLYSFAFLGAAMPAAKNLAGAKPEQFTHSERGVNSTSTSNYQSELGTSCFARQNALEISSRPDHKSDMHSNKNDSRALDNLAVEKNFQPRTHHDALKNWSKDIEKADELVRSISIDEWQKVAPDKDGCKTIHKGDTTFSCDSRREIAVRESDGTMLVYKFHMQRKGISHLEIYKPDRTWIQIDQHGRIFAEGTADGATINYLYGLRRGYETTLPFPAVYSLIGSHIDARGHVIAPAPEGAPRMAHRRDNNNSRITVWCGEGAKGELNSVTLKISNEGREEFRVTRIRKGKQGPRILADTILEREPDGSWLSYPKDKSWNLRTVIEEDGTLKQFYVARAGGPIETICFHMPTEPSYLGSLLFDGSARYAEVAPIARSKDTSALILRPTRTDSLQEALLDYLHEHHNLEPASLTQLPGYGLKLDLSMPAPNSLLDSTFQNVLKQFGFAETKV